MRLAIIVAGLASVLMVGSADAALTLTVAGTSQGLSLSTFASGFQVYAPNNSGPVGIAFLDNGVLVCDEPGNPLLFPSDADGQNANNASVVLNFGPGNEECLLRVGSAVYMTEYPNGQVVQLNSNGTFQRTIASVSTATGLVPNPTNGHLFVGSFLGGEIWDLNPANGALLPFASAAQPDGLALSPDGRTLYAAAANISSVVGFDTTTGTQVYNSGQIPGVVDGLALGTGNFAGKLFVNTNGGTLVEVDLSTNAQTVIASGGSRGDFVSVDPTNDTLLITQTDSVLRLSGATFAPEPASLSVGALVASMFLLSRRRSPRAVSF